jgi:hypothetical protein
MNQFRKGREFILKLDCIDVVVKNMLFTYVTSFMIWVEGPGYFKFWNMPFVILLPCSISVKLAAFVIVTN